MPARDAYAARSFAHACRVQEQGATGPLTRQSRAGAGQVGAQRVLRVAADRHLALLPALPHDADEPALQIEVVHVEPGEFRDPHARSVEELEDRAVTQSGRRGTVRRLDEAPDLLDTQRMRKRARYAGSDDLARGVVWRDPLADHEAMERTNGREDS